MKNVLLSLILFCFSLIYALETDSVKVDGNYIPIQYVRTCTNKDTLNFFWEEYLRDAQDTFMDFEDTDKINFLEETKNYCMNKYLRKYGYSRLKKESNRIYIQKKVIKPYIERYFDYKVTDHGNFLVTSMTKDDDYMTKKPKLKFIKMEFYTQGVIKALFRYQEENNAKVKTQYSYYLKKREDNTWYFVCARKELINKPKLKAPGFSGKLTALNIDGTYDLSPYLKIENDSVIYYLDFYYDDFFEFIKIDKKSLKVLKNCKISNPINEYLEKGPEIDKEKIVFNIYGREQKLILYPEKERLIITKMNHSQSTDLVLPDLQRRLTNLHYAESPEYYLYHDQKGVFLYDKNTKEEKKIQDRDTFEWQMEACFVNKGQQVAYFFIDDEFESELYLYDIKRKELKTLFYPSYGYEGNFIFLDSLASSQRNKNKIQIYSFQKGMIEIEVDGDVINEVSKNRDFFVIGSKNSIHIYNKKTNALRRNVLKIGEENELNQFFPYFDIVDVWEDGRLLIQYFNDISDYKYYITKESFSK